MNAATPGQAGKPFHWHGTMAEFDAEVRRRWIESSERLGLDHGMPNAAAALAAQERPAPAPDGKTGSQVAYEAWRAATAETLAWEPDEIYAFGSLSDTERRPWEAVAQAVETAVRERMLALAARLEESAAQTAPSRKTEIEREAAIAVRQAVEP